MDNKQKNMIEQYYKSNDINTAYCKECGCAIDMPAENKSQSDVNYPKAKVLIIVLFIALALLCAALIVCTHIINDLKKSAADESIIARNINIELKVQ